ncbi:hypothetical protein SCLCIDRAFT_1221160 [Scleroderma citrinum Foug A]|uniref:Uncharacterized protein n=1 Tax=Scleroderma citrinum Foug A TaxID=1036808 RepID=A0A0C3D3G1_9AGAM|nr:hypothetical protein SCLCIDRAFT_1221160 [Scleroderma citrinum Foug A]
MALFDDRNNKSWQVTRCYASNLLNTSLRAPMTYCGELSSCIYKVHIIVFPPTVQDLSDLMCFLSDHVH